MFGVSTRDNYCLSNPIVRVVVSFFPATGAKRNGGDVAGRFLGESSAGLWGRYFCVPCLDCKTARRGRL